MITATTRSDAVDVAALGELAQHRGRDAAGGLGEDPGRLRQQLDAVADLVVGDSVDRAAAATRELERVRPVGRVADRQRLGDRVRLDRLAEVAARRSNAVATGEQPSAWAPLKVGSSPSSSPTSSHSSKPRAIFVNSEPEAIGATTRSGSSNPSCSAISNASVFEPSA